jgi:hypothetical protein
MLNTGERGGRAIAISLYRERPVVARAIDAADLVPLRFLACLVFCEYLTKSSLSPMLEIGDMRAALQKHL